MLDADVLWLAPFESALVMLPRDAIALSYANKAHLSLNQWAYVYDTLGLALPKTRCTLADSLLDESPPGEALCYYNSGVVSAPWRFDLGALWGNLIDRIPGILQANEEGFQLARMALLDQPPLAVAVDLLRRKGMKTLEIPTALHTRWQHICLGLVNEGDVVLAHNTGMFKRSGARGGLAGIRAYQELTRSRRDGSGGTEIERERLRGYAAMLGDYLVRLYEKYIA